MFKKFGPLPENSSPLLVSQACYGPAYMLIYRNAEGYMSRESSGYPVLE